jgi:hypothetical protein
VWCWAEKGFNFASTANSAIMTMVQLTIQSSSLWQKQKFTVGLENPPSPTRNLPLPLGSCQN